MSRRGSAGQHGGDVVGQAAGQAVRGSRGRCPRGRPRVEQRLGRSRGDVAVRGARQEARSLGEHEIDVDPGVHLDGRVMHPRRVRVRPALHAEGPEARGVRAQPGLVAVQALRDVLHEGPRVVGAVGGPRARPGSRRRPSCPRGDGGAHREGLAHRSLGGPVAVLGTGKTSVTGIRPIGREICGAAGNGRDAVVTHTMQATSDRPLGASSPRSTRSAGRGWGASHAPARVVGGFRGDPWSHLDWRT
jgi:hypothetical protein